jgi:hypothetical protein
MMSVPMAAVALANALMGATPGEKPFRAVAFVLSLAAHRRAGARNPVELHKRIKKMTAGVGAVLRARKGVNYDPLDVVEFGSFDALLSKRPPQGTTWQDILIVSHAGGEAQTGTAQLYFGDEFYVVSALGMNDFIDAINGKLNRVNRFRAGFDLASEMTIVGCGVGATGELLPVWVRELFGTEGLVRYPIKNVDLFANGQLGTPADPEDPLTLRRLVDADWRELPSKDAQAAGLLLPSDL